MPDGFKLKEKKRYSQKDLFTLLANTIFYNPTTKSTYGFCAEALSSRHKRGYIFHKNGSLQRILHDMNYKLQKGKEIVIGKSCSTISAGYTLEHVYSLQAGYSTRN